MGHKHNDQSTPRAHGFTLVRCGDPECSGVHIVAFDRREKPICDIAVTPEAAPSFIRALQDLLYVQAVERE